jgi:hypothetical protein
VIDGAGAEAFGIEAQKGAGIGELAALTAAVTATDAVVRDRQERSREAL